MKANIWSVQMDSTKAQRGINEYYSQCAQRKVSMERNIEKRCAYFIHIHIHTMIFPFGISNILQSTQKRVSISKQKKLKERDEPKEKEMYLI